MSARSTSARLGILGGSFDPIHIAHLAVATRVAERLNLDRVLLVPTAVSPLKPRGAEAPARHRLEMVRRAIRRNALFRVSTLETRRDSVSYTVDTLRAIRKRTRAKLYLILGTDAFRLIPEWKEAETVKKLATIVVVARPGDRPAPRMPKHYIVETPLLEISSTGIRKRVRRGLSIRYLVPDAVEAYIRRKGLYRR